MEREHRRWGLIPQIGVLLLVVAIVIGMITMFTQQVVSDTVVRNQTERVASRLSEETALSIKEYPAYNWLLEYWHDNAYDMEIEYDVGYRKNTETAKKAQLLGEKYPDIQLKYATVSDINKMTAEDQKIYAEVAYSWLTYRMDQIKRSHDAAFLFLALTDADHKTQFFLLSGADEGAKRGWKYEDIYPLGKKVEVSGTQKEGMDLAKDHHSYLADAGKYVDYYTYFGRSEDNDLFIGMTYDQSELISDINRRAWIQTGIAVAIQLVMAWLILGLLYRVALQPVGRLQETIRRYMHSKDSTWFRKELKEVRPGNEIGELSKDMSDMSSELDEYMETNQRITADKERINAELAVGTRIQAAMLPSEFPAFPEKTEFDVYASMNPAREVGGDFYDFFLVDDDHMAMVMADVSGKGIPAALFMMASKILIGNETKTGKSPSAVLAKVNNAICANNPEDMFLTAWLGILELSTGRLIAANAGHENPLIRNGQGEFEIYKDKHGFVLGGMEGMKYPEYEIMLKPDSRIFLYTDGVPEATGKDNAMFGMDRLLETLNKVPEADPKTILHKVREDVDAFTGEAEQFDDLTMLCLEYRGAQSSADEGEVSSIEVDAAAEELDKVRNFIGSCLDKAECSPKTQMEIELAAEEIFINIASYAYKSDNGKARVSAEISGQPPVLTLTFADRGIPYDPLSREDPDVTESYDKRKIGGLGIFLTKQTMDELQYEYRDGMNILTMRKGLS